MVFARNGLRSLIGVHDLDQAAISWASPHANGARIYSPPQSAAQAPVVTVESEDSAFAMSWFTAGSASA
jgi:hypothetical protein